MESEFIVDYDRQKRLRIPEAVFCQGKDIFLLQDLLEQLYRHGEAQLLTRLLPEQWRELSPSLQEAIDYHELSRTGWLLGRHEPWLSKGVAVVSAGSSDRSVAWEVARCLEFMGVQLEMFTDVGVAGLWRLQERLPRIKEYGVVVAVAGMEGALPTVLGGLVPQPLIAVPSSVGYGVSAGGEAAMTSMLSSCAPGITVVNIDNGYGAAMAALRILRASAS
jgi:NCAIR mutase (PurE)-related protein